MRVTIVDKPPQDVRTFGVDDLSGKLTQNDVETIREIFKTPLTGSYNWDYDSANAKIRRLYELGKVHNWNSTLDVDWDAPCDMNDFPMEASIGALNGYPEYEALSHAEKVRFAWKGHAQTMSQFLHGEQGAMLVASQLVSCAPTADAKLYAASQTFDEARHVEVFNGYLRRRCGMMYPINKNLKALIDKVLADERWDLKFIGMQLIIEGLALAAFGTQVRTTKDPLLKQIVELVMRDEGRHVAFGVNYLEDWIKVLPQHEIEDRAEFAYQACAIMRDRLFGMDVIREYGFNEEAAQEAHPRQRRDRHVPRASVRADHAELEARRPAHRPGAAEVRGARRAEVRRSGRRCADRLGPAREAAADQGKPGRCKGGRGIGEGANCTRAVAQPRPRAWCSSKRQPFETHPFG